MHLRPAQARLNAKAPSQTEGVAPSRAHLAVPVVVHARLPVHRGALRRYHNVVLPLAAPHLARASFHSFSTLGVAVPLQTPAQHCAVANTNGSANEPGEVCAMLPAVARMRACLGSSSVGSISLMTPDVQGTCGPTVGLVASGCACPARAAAQGLCASPGGLAGAAARWHHPARVGAAEA